MTRCRWRWVERAGLHVVPPKLGLVAAVSALSACSEQIHFLGYDVAVDAAEETTGVTSGAPVVDAALLDAGNGGMSEERDSSLVSTSPVDADSGLTGDGGLVTVVLHDPPNVLVDVLGIEPDRAVQRTSNIFRTAVLR